MLFWYNLGKKYLKGFPLFYDNSVMEEPLSLFFLMT